MLPFWRIANSARCGGKGECFYLSIQFLKATLDVKVSRYVMKLSHVTACRWCSRVARVEEFHVFNCHPCAFLVNG
jgi:hypothetical protein